MAPMLLLRFPNYSCMYVCPGECWHVLAIRAGQPPEHPICLICFAPALPAARRSSLGLQDAIAIQVKMWLQKQTMHKAHFNVAPNVYSLCFVAEYV